MDREGDLLSLHRDSPAVQVEIAQTETDRSGRDVSEWPLYKGIYDQLSASEHDVMLGTVSDLIRDILEPLSEAGIYDEEALMRFVLLNVPFPSSSNVKLLLATVPICFPLFYQQLRILVLHK